MEFKDSKPNTIRVRNLSPYTVNISGMWANCGCIQIRGLPQKIEGFGTKEFQISVGEIDQDDKGRKLAYKLICEGKCAYCSILLNP